MGTECITVALATYKRPDELMRALEALSQQKIEHLHILVSDDDPSKVNQEAITRKFPFKIEYLWRKEKKGVLHNHLSMIDLCRSGLFMFHGDDDLIMPGSLNILSSSLSKHPKYGAVFANYRKGLDLQKSQAVMLARLPFVRHWGHSNRMVRMLGYYLCPTFLGKQNLFYGLYRNTTVQKIDIDKALPRRSEYLNLDEMYSFQAVCNVPVLVIDAECYFFSEGNLKHYQDSSLKASNTLNAMSNFIHYEWITLFDYLRNVQSIGECILLIIFFPIKLLIALFWRYGRSLLSSVKNLRFRK